MAKRKVRKLKKTALWFRGTFAFLLLGLMSFAFFNLLNTGVEDGLTILGIENFYIQMTILLASGFVFFLIIGWPIFKVLNKVLGK